MAYDNRVNEIQALIMRQLFMKDILRFSEINTDSLPSDQFSYHLRQLVKNDLIEKTDDNRYRLSTMGRSRAIMMDNRSNKFIEQGFVACRVVLTRQHKGVKQYLVQRRTRVPFHGYVGEPGGKILFGEDVLEAAKRNMIIETGLDCDITLKGMTHYKDRYEGQVVQDKFFFIVQATNPTGTLLPAGPTGENIWLSLEEIQSGSKVYKGLKEILMIADGESFTFFEETHLTEDY
jgi:8-oxo-dGTP pyrophosphatase MutT (NUDIX family)